MMQYVFQYMLTMLFIIANFAQNTYQSNQSKYKSTINQPSRKTSLLLCKETLGLFHYLPLSTLAFSQRPIFLLPSTSASAKNVTFGSPLVVIISTSYPITFFSTSWQIKNKLHEKCDKTTHTSLQLKVGEKNPQEKWS